MRVLNLVRFAHPPEAEHDGTMEYWVHLCSMIAVKIQSFYGETVKIDPKNLDPNTEAMRF